MFYDTDTGETGVLLDRLLFANGLALSPREDFLLVSETTVARITRYWLKGAKKGTRDTFAENLPGFPDNIRNAVGGGYWVGFGAKRAQPFSLLDTIAPYPMVKNLLAKIVPKRLIVSFVKSYGLIVKMDEEGELVESLHDPTGAVIAHISEVVETKDVLYLGSYKNRFLGVLRKHQ